MIDLSNNLDNFGMANGRFLYDVLSRQAVTCHRAGISHTHTSLHFTTHKRRYSRTFLFTLKLMIDVCVRCNNMELSTLCTIAFRGIWPILLETSAWVEERVDFCKNWPQLPGMYTYFFVKYGIVNMYRMDYVMDSGQW